MARPRLSAEAADGIRADICAAAAALYERDGYDAVTLRAIAAAMGRSQALPYRYFKNKEHIFAALRAVWFDRLTALLEAAIEGLESPLLKLHTIARTVIAFAQSQPSEYRLMFSLRQPDPTDFPELHAARLRAMATVQTAYQEAVDARLIPGDGATGAHVTWASLHGLLSLHLAGQLTIGRSLEELIQPMLDTLFGPRLMAVVEASARSERRRKQAAD
ncbi:TetR/AcrR family transcriptional regulator [Nevskia sp.]|uniref:TetR/AcrR family transcriptional regulator n=1 Tax=Nevskia sp. TaxID=1929292 RepID=UPI0025EE3255|nr:TetR/AcrR family transcriptional regulator [Nevskia sp.]